MRQVGSPTGHRPTAASQPSTMSRMSSSSWASASGVTSTATCWSGRDVAVRDPDRAHADLLRAVHVLEEPVADVDGALAARRRPRAQAARNASGCGFTTWISRGVDVAVEQVEDAVALEHLTVVGAAPDRVGQHPDPDARASCSPSQSGRTCGSVWVCGSQNRRYAASARWCRSCSGSTPASARMAAIEALSWRLPPPRQAPLLGLVDAQRERVGLGEVLGGHRRVVDGQAVHLAGEDPPLLGQVHLVPRRQRAAPVEDDRLDGLGRGAGSRALGPGGTAAATASTTSSTGDLGALARTRGP